MKPDLIAPPPWRLAGEGTVLLYHFPRGFNQEYGFMEPFQSKGYKGWIGAVMLVEYTTSEVGPYFELLCIPGFFTIGGKFTFSVSRIFVSTHESAWNGRHNWGLPKQVADFTVVKRADGERLYEVEVDGHLFLKAHVKPWSPSVPFSNKVVPFTRIVQQIQDQLLLTRPVASGYMQLASLKQVAAEPNYFPPLHQLKPLACLYMPDFLMTFPKPEELWGS
ncbi:hypothetical protein ACFS7Z_14515 [Pontibacter toksunensis]|uniref:Acetoacetate decarboxylase n=1 Tax=Pontibacter toksunensis TaxID=1332631 RepID=A0ABW6BWS7_9BACT